MFPSVSWMGMPLGEAFDWVYQNNGWFQSLEFEAKRESKLYAEMLITRQGIVRTNRHVQEVFESFIIPICDIIHNNILTLSHRGRLERPNYLPKPLIIKFAKNYFEDIEDNSKFIEAMKLLKTASISVSHSNPYINISVVDYFDGSSFDLWVLSQNQVHIVPQLKGTVAATKRLINHIFNSFAEGEIEEYEGNY